MSDFAQSIESPPRRVLAPRILCVLDAFARLCSLVLRFDVVGPTCERGDLITTISLYKTLCLPLVRCTVS
jgi:hypothetical protein